MKTVKCIICGGDRLDKKWVDVTSEHLGDVLFNLFGVGSLWVRSGWAMIGLKDKWQNTGDMVYRSPDGCYFYRGRSDNMVVCGGENVYPENVEKVINSHTDVLNSMVYPVTDPHFGTVLNAKVELKPDSTLTSETLKEILRPQLSRAEMPHHITITAISLKNSGKIARMSNSTESWR